VRTTRAALGISRERMARVCDVSAKTIERWEGVGALPASPAHRLRLATLREIAELGRIVYEDEGFRLFLTTPLRSFEDRTPLQAMEAGQLERVRRALAGDYEGSGH
jgi:transcriptional regulator with XRE-family HTH domain